MLLSLCILYEMQNQFFQHLLPHNEFIFSWISNMAQQMKGKFDKYWNCYSVVLACATVLDPRCKLDFADYTFKKIEPYE